MIDLEDFRTKLGLELLGPTTKKQLDINVTDINRPGMQFCGFYEYFAHERVQVIGKVEMTYLESLESRMRRPVLEKYMSYPIPCIITCWGMTPPRDLLEIARAHDVPVFQSKLKTTKFSLQAIMYLNRVLAPHITRHGVLVDVYGVGILLTGESGVGKSEAALELVKRGHQLAADDVVDICRVGRRPPHRRIAGDGAPLHGDPRHRHHRHPRHVRRGIGHRQQIHRHGHPHGKVGLLQGIRPPGPHGGNRDHSGREGALPDHARPAGAQPGHHHRGGRAQPQPQAHGYSAAHELDRRLNELIAQNSGNHT